MKIEIIPYATIPLAFNVADIVTTEIGLPLGATEQNPLYSAPIIIFKLLFFIAIIPFSHYTIKRQANLRNPILMFNTIFIIFFALCVINNIAVITQLARR